MANETKVEVNFNVADYSNVIITVEGVDPKNAVATTKKIYDSLVQTYGRPGGKMQPAQGGDNKDKDDGKMIVSGNIVYDPEVKFVSTEKQDSVAVCKIVVKQGKINYYANMWGTDGEEAAAKLNKNDKVKVEGYLKKVEKNGKTYHNLNNAQVLEPDLSLISSPNTGSPDGDYWPDDDIPF